MNFENEIVVLKNFNQTVDTLQGFNFWKTFPDNSGISIEWDYTQDGVTVNSKVIGPNDEAISAFILKYRLFIQDKDEISLRNMDKLFSTLPIKNEYYFRFKSIRNKINENLDRPSNVTRNNHKVTMREIHDMFIYGVWAHLDDKDVNRKRYLSIKENPVIYPMFANDFNLILLNTMNELVQIKLLNEEVLEILENS